MALLNHLICVILQNIYLLIDFQFVYELEQLGVADLYEARWSHCVVSVTSKEVPVVLASLD